MNLYDCHGGPGTTEPACGACATCLHRVIEQKDQIITRLKDAARAVYLDSIASDHPWTKPETRNMHALRDVLEDKP